MTNKGHALSREELLRALTAYSGITTNNGAADGTTLVDINLIGRNDFITGKTILIGSGDAKDEDKGATLFDSVNGVITVQGTGFSDQIEAGTIYRILNISSIEIDVVNIQEDLGDMADDATADDMSDILTTSALAKLRLILNRMSTDAFAATIQGASRTALDIMLAQMALYFAASGAAINATVDPGGSARTNLEQILEDLGAMLAGAAGITTFPSAADIANGVSLAEAIRAILTSMVGGDDYDGYTKINNVAVASLNAAFQQLASLFGAAATNTFSVSLDGSARTDLDALYTALGVLLGTRDVAAHVTFPSTTAGLMDYLKGQQIAQGLCYYGDITTYTDTTHIESTTLGGFETGFFIGWSCFLIKDDGGGGATPQGARSLVTAFTTTTGAITLASALPAAGAVGDQIMLVHPVLLDAWNMRGGAETLESLDDELDAMMDMAKVPDTRTISVIGTEETITNLGVTGAVPFFVAGIWLGMENMAAGDVVRWRVFVDWDDASIADQLTDDEVWTFGGVQPQKWTYMPLNFWVTYEIAVKVTQLDGTARELYCVLDTGQRGS